MLAVLQVAIGICFVFLLFSLIVSAANELVQAILSMRAAQLKAGIGELLQDRKFQNAAKEFCNHPLISCLSKGAGGQPSYIAPRTFVITVLDLLREGQIVVDGAKGSDLAAQIAKIENPELRRALSSLFDQANKEAAIFEKALETWFNEAMDRVGGWYKRWIQYWLFGLGLALAAAANVDTLHIIGALSTNPKMQLATADAAIGYLKAQSGTQTGSGFTSNPSPPGTPVQVQNPEVSPRETTKPEGSTAPSSAATPKPLTTAQSLETTATDLASLEVPLGWAGPERSYFTRHWWSAIFGWLLTALAASIGAPFWFDTLNRFINIRAAGRSPDEDPKGAKLQSREHQNP
jgi:cell division septation protein DedD